MKKIMAGIALTASAALAPAAATTVYDFKVLTWGCSIELPFGYCGDASGTPNGLQVGLKSLAGSIHVETYGYPNYPSFVYDNDGVTYTNFRKAGTQIDMTKKTCMSPGICIVKATFEVDVPLRQLTGSFESLDTSEMYGMSSGPDGIWSGFYRSDNGHSNELYRVFTGVWFETPEPTSLALFGAGLAGLIGLSRRKRQAQGVSAS